MTKIDVKQLRRAETSLKDVNQRFALELTARRVTDYGAEIILQNSVAGVKIRHSAHDGNGLHVLVARLVDGNFPPHPDLIHENTDLCRFDIRDIASLRLDRLPATLAVKIQNDKPLDGQDVATLLRSCCSDILVGDFSVFAAVQRIVKERAKAINK
jgi:hypothetical protein